MASLEHTINVIFGASTNSTFNSTLHSISAGLDDLDAGVQKVAGPVASFTGGLLAAEAALAALAVTMIGTAVDAAGKYSQATLQLGANFNATKEESGKLGAELLAFGKTSSASYADIQEAANIALSTGTDASEITKLLSDNQKLAAVGGESLATATSVLAKSLNAYGESADKAKPYGDALFLAAQQGDTNFKELASQLGAVTSTAAASKVPFDDLMSAVSAVTIAGVSTSETMTKLKSLFLELSVPSDKLKEALGGVTLEGDGLQAVMIKVKEVTGGTTDKMSGLFSSSEALSAATILANDSAGVFATTLEKMADKTGIVEKNYANMTDSFDQSNTKLANNMQAALIQIGTPLLDEYGSISKGVAAIFDALGNSVNSGPIKDLEGSVEEFVKGAATKIQGIADALPSALSTLNFDSLVDAFGELAGQFSDIFDTLFGANLDLTKPEDLAKALQKGVDILTALVSVTTGIVEEFKPMFELIAAMSDEVANADDATTKTTGSIAGALTALSAFGTGLGAAFVFISETGTSITDVFTVIVNGVKIFINGIQSFFDLLERGVATFIADFYEAKAALTFGDTSVQAQKDADKWLAIVGGINADIAKNGEEIQGAWGKMSDAVSGSNDKAADSSKESSKKIVDSTKEFVIASGDAMAAWNAGIEGGTKTASESLSYTADQFAEYSKKTDELTAAGVKYSSEWTETGGKIVTVAGDIKGATAAMFAFDIGNGKTQLEDLTGAFMFGKDEVGGFQAKVDELNKLGFTFLKDWNDETGGVIKVTDSMSAAVDNDAKAVDKQAEAAKKATDTLKDKKKATDDLTESQKIAIKHTNDMEIKLLELASNEKLKYMEFSASIKTAQIEADAKTIEAAFNSVSDTFESANKTVTDLYGLLSGKDLSLSDKWAIQDAAEEAAANAKKALENATKLNDAQVKYMNAKTDLMLSGKGMITVNADGLAPELQSVLKSLLEYVQLEANAEGLELLLP